MTVISVSDYRDTCGVVTLVTRAGAVLPGDEQVSEQKVPFVNMVVNEIIATANGVDKDVKTLLDNSNITLSKDGRILFERPLSALVLTVENRDAKTDARLCRLERMMNVLVEQDSPAGEALRRLGGAKITYESLTRLAVPQLFLEHDSYAIRLHVHTKFELLNDVTVQIFIFGIKKSLVL